MRASGSAWILWALVPAFLGVHVILRLAASRSLGVDDAEFVVFDQALAWGYDEQPPLYAWIVRLVSLPFGANVMSLTLLRSALLGGTIWLTAACLRMLRVERRLCALGACSIVFAVLFAWHALTYLTHSVLLAVLCLATVYSALRVMRRPAWREYAVLGLVVGLGALSKYNYAFFALAMLLSAISLPETRRRILSVRLLLSGVVAVVVVLPHAVWLMDHFDLVRSEYASKVTVAGAGRIAGVPRGGLEVAMNAVLLAAPYAVMVGLCGGALRPAAALSPEQRWIARCVPVLVGLTFLYALVTMAPRFHERWLEPFCVLLPLAVVSRLDPAALQPARLRRLGLAVCLCAAGLTVARAGQIWYGGSARGITPFDLSFDAAAARIRPAAPPGSVLISRDRGLAGNLRQHIPGLSCLCLDLPLHTPPRVDGRANRVLVWDATRQRSVPDSLLAYARGAAGIGARKAGPARFVELPCLPVAQPSRLLGWLVIPGKGSSPAFPYAGYSVSSRKLTAASARLQR